MTDRRVISISVFSVHVLAVILLCIYGVTPVIDSPKRFAVKTISLKQEAAVGAPVAEIPKAISIPQKEAPKPQPKEEKKIPTPVPVAPKEPVAKAKKAPNPIISNDAIAKAKKALANIQKGPITTEAVAPKLSLNIEGINLSVEEGSSYISEIISRIKTRMKLPDAGEVVVELTLERSGKVLKMLIKEAKSIHNKNYVEKTLPSIKFPVFEGGLKNEKSHTFIFVLNSEI
jgi:hypothetical protein